MFVATTSTASYSNRAPRAARVASPIALMAALCPSIRRAAAQKPPARTAQAESDTRSPDPPHCSEPWANESVSRRDRLGARDHVASPPPDESSPKGEPDSSEAMSRPPEPT